MTTSIRNLPRWMSFNASTRHNAWILAWSHNFWDCIIPTPSNLQSAYKTFIFGRKWTPSKIIIVKGRNTVFRQCSSPMDLFLYIPILSVAIAWTSLLSKIVFIHKERTFFQAIKLATHINSTKWHAKKWAIDLSHSAQPPVIAWSRGESHWSRRLKANTKDPKVAPNAAKNEW